MWVNRNNGLLCAFALAIVLFSYFTLPDIAVSSSRRLRTILSGTVYKHNSTDLRIIVITYNRAKSLLRLLESLNNAMYYGDTVVLEVWIDRNKNGTIDPKTLAVASKFHFSHGAYTVNRHTTHVGIYGQWLDTWHPNPDSSEIAVILEDDLSVSPYFYKWLKNVHTKYDSYTDINGYSLQGVSIKHNGAPGYVEAPQNCIVYLYQTLGTWGFSPVTTKWLGFKKWYSKVHVTGQFRPFVPGNIATDWYKIFLETNKADGMWEIWHIYYAWKNREYTLYINLPGKIFLTIKPI